MKYAKVVPFACVALLLSIATPAAAQSAPPEAAQDADVAGISSAQMATIRQRLAHDHRVADNARLIRLTQEAEGGTVRSVFVLGTEAEASKVSNPFELPTMTTLLRPDGTVLVRSYRAVARSEAEADGGVAVSPISYVVGPDGAITSEAPSGGTLRARAMNSSRVQKRAMGFHAAQTTTLLVVHCYFVVWDPELQLDYAFHVYGQDYVNCDAPGDVADTVAIWSLFHGGHGDTTRFAALTAGGFGWQYTAARKFYCNLSTSSDNYWTQQFSTVWIPGFNSMHADQLSPNTPVIQCL